MAETSPPILYSFRRCPYAMRARMALLYASVEVELREVLLRDKPHAMIEASPKATVPVLVLPNGQVIDESLEIMHQALNQADPDGWYEPALQNEIDTLIAANDGPFKHALDRYKYPNRYPDEAIAVDQQRSIAGDVIAGYERRLKQSGGGLVVSKHTLADYAILPFVRQFAHVDTVWFYSQPWPSVIAWLDAFKTSALFEAVMIKHSPWKPDDEPVLFGCSQPAL